MRAILESMKKADFQPKLSTKSKIPKNMLQKYQFLLKVEHINDQGGSLSSVLQPNVEDAGSPVETILRMLQLQSRVGNLQRPVIFIIFITALSEQISECETISPGGVKIWINIVNLVIGGNLLNQRINGEM